MRRRDTSAITNPQMQTFRDLHSRPVATITQRKTTAKRNLEQDHDQIENVSEMRNEIPDTPRSNIDDHVKGLGTAISSEGVQE